MNTISPESKKGEKRCSEVGGGRPEKEGWGENNKKTIVLAKHQTGGKERIGWRNRKKRSTPQWWKAKLRRQRQQFR